MQVHQKGLVPCSLLEGPTEPEIRKMTSELFGARLVEKDYQHNLHPSRSDQEPDLLINMREMEGKKMREYSGIGELNTPKRNNGHRMVTSSKFSMLHLTTFRTVPPSDRSLHSNF